MTGICFFFEPSDVDVWSGKNLDAWNYAIKAAGDIDKMIVINKTDQTIKSPDKTLDFQVVDKIPILPNAYILTTPWDLENQSISLWDCDHQCDWYIFGPASGWQGVLPSMDGEINVSIPQSGLGALHSVHIASAVMLHRYHVRGS